MGSGGEGEEEEKKHAELLGTFDDLEIDPPKQTKHDRADEEFDQRLKDQADKLKWRKIYYISLLLLLFGQNMTVFLLILFSHWLQIDIKAISIVATATLAETYGLVTIIVKHLVKDINYKN